MVRREDDLVFTLSDNDNLSISGASEPEELYSAPPPQKRKRGKDKIAKEPKKRRVQDEGSGISSDEDVGGNRDDTIDPDFEFDLGSRRPQDLVEDFDGWRGTTVKQKPTKTAVDIDEIIAHRAQKRAQQGLNFEAQSQDEAIDQDESEEEREGEAVVADEDEDGDGEEAEAIILDDDELVAEDAFAANAASSDPEGDSEVDGQLGYEDAGDASESGSIASPTAHPDDLASDHSDTESRTSASDPEEMAKRAAFFASEATVSKPAPNPSQSFQQFSLSRPILRAVSTLNISTPTPIQTRTIPLALAGHDIVGSAITGSGKTLAFLLPILERLLYRPRRVPTTRVAVLLPTRELAVQCHTVTKHLTASTDITSTLLVGGLSLREQESQLKLRPDIIVATPGRLIDHVRNSPTFSPEAIEILVLDEADRMLETGFEAELNEILRLLPRSRQTLLFSATMTSTIDNLVRLGMNKPIRISINPSTSTNTTLVQEFIRLRPERAHLRLATLCILLLRTYTTRTIIFLRTKSTAHRIRILLGLLGLRAGELHGSMTQEARLSAVAAFRDGSTTHLLATDVASRGLDIKNVETVINYEAPQTHEIYLHRVGRTARAGKSGRACTIAAEPDRKIVKAAVKAGRAQGAKIVSRSMDAEAVDEMHERIESLEPEIDAILKEEKEARLLAQANSEIERSANLIKHQDEIMARPRRTWFETESQKQNTKQRALAELNGADGVGVRVKGEKKKLSNKDRKRLDAKRERKEGKNELMGKRALLKKANEARSKQGAKKKKAKKAAKR